MEPIDQFLDNAVKYNHKMHSVIIAYQDYCDFDIVRKLQQRIEVHVVKVFDCKDVLCKELDEIGLSPVHADNLLNCSGKKGREMVPYGQNRNHVVMKAMMKGTDVLFFIDTDVYPRVLVRKNDEIIEQEVDFVGEHLKLMKEKNVYITTSDYTGYYIIPRMKFDGMKALFNGLQKDSCYQYIMDSYQHKCLNLEDLDNRKTFESNKILGGNVAIRLEAFKRILPFFSTTYEVDKNKYLTRGEDTLLGIGIDQNEDMKCIDIDLKIFHNTYGHFPTVPDIEHDNNIKNRFFYASMGWIGRNPFLNWINGHDVDQIKKYQLEQLTKGAPKVAKYLNDERFLILPKALENAYGDLDRVINEYKQFEESWKAFVSLM